VLENRLAALATLGARPERVTAAIGPCIGPESYEVGPEFRDRFAAEHPDNAAFFATAGREGCALFDLPGYVARRLAKAGVGTIARLAYDTLHDAERFFSYRRATISGERAYGRLLSAIALVP